MNQELWDRFVIREEYLKQNRDKHGRFTHTLSSYSDVLSPNVSRILKDNGLHVEYPDSKRFAVCLSHDVDNIYPPLLHVGLSALVCMRSLDFAELGRQVRGMRGRKGPSPYRNFGKIIELERKYGAKSTFYFLTQGKDRMRFRYHIEELAEDLKLIANAGWDIGLHVAYDSFNDPEKVSAEKARLEELTGREVLGCRVHYLRFRVPDTWQVLANAGLRYDTTFGYADHVGFRNGVCHPFRPYNLATEQEIDIIEIPLVAMDDTIFRYMKLNKEEAVTLIKGLVDTVQSLNGVLTLLWHNDDFGCPFLTPWAQVYESVLQYCVERNAWLTSVDEIYRWYNKNDYAGTISSGLKRNHN